MAELTTGQRIVRESDESGCGCAACLRKRKQLAERIDAAIAEAQTELLAEVERLKQSNPKTEALAKFTDHCQRENELIAERDALKKALKELMGLSGNHRLGAKAREIIATILGAALAAGTEEGKRP